MKLATVATPDTTAVTTVLPDGRLQPLTAPSLAALLQAGADSEAARPAGAPLEDSQVRFLPVVPSPGKILCVGLNYRSHIEEMGRPLPAEPTLFAKFAATLAGSSDDIELPPNTGQVDWEAELAFVIGSPLYRPDSAAAASHAIAGYTVANDVSMRDWQWRTTQWLPGKVFDHSTPLGPYLTTSDEVSADDLALTCTVDGNIVQQASTSDLLFKPADIAAYISQFTELLPGDVILTGTPGGVGAGRDPQVFLQPGNVLTTSIEGLGTCTNRITSAQR